MIWGYAIAMVIVALFLLLWPLWRRTDSSTLDSNTANVAVLKEQIAELDSDLESGNLTDEQYQSARRDLETAVAADLADEGEVHQLSAGSRKVLSIMLVILMPLGSVLFYQQVTTYREIPATEHPAQKVVEQVAGEKLPPITQMVEVLAERLRNDPENGEGWQMLGRSYMIMERVEDAARAYGRAYKLMGESNPRAIVDYAEALAFANDNQMAGKPEELVDEALAIQPDMSKALWLKGFAYYQIDDFNNAVSSWEKVLANPDVGGETRQMMATYIADARSRMTGEDKPMFRPVPAEQQQAASVVSVTVNVSLDESIGSGIDADSSVFVFAKAVSGPPMPLAVKKLRVAELPTTVVLDENMAMMPGHSLSSHEQVIVGARVSRSGAPMSQVGDIEGLAAPLNPSSESEVNVVIKNIIQ